MLTEEERERRVRERERAEVNKRKEQQLKRMDDIKKLMIQEVMRSGGPQMDAYQGIGMTRIEYYDQLLYGDEGTQGTSEEDRKK